MTTACSPKFEAALRDQESSLQIPHVAAHGPVQAQVVGMDGMKAEHVQMWSWFTYGGGAMKHPGSLAERRPCL